MKVNMQSANRWNFKGQKICAVLASFTLLSAPLAAWASVQNNANRVRKATASAHGLRKGTATKSARGQGLKAVGSQGNASRLPDFARPKKYVLTIEPNLREATFRGNETIILDLSRPANEIVLNAADLTIERATAGGVTHSHTGTCAAKVVLNKKAEQARLLFPHVLTQGRHEINITFKGCLNDKLRGFYKAEYKDESGKRHVLATTQMEPTDARRMFPCFDEPDFKANFQIIAVVDPELQAISNAEIQSQKVDAKRNKKIVEFAPTPKMSSYLVALIVGNLEASAPTVVDGVAIRVWTTPGKSRMGGFAQSAAGKFLSFYNSYFRIPYPEKKLDLVSIPDFEAGAMENLGAITFRENLLLVDDKSISAEHKRWVAEVVAHEMAHMWFGDLVTMKWWDDIWLNEAFATWMATKVVNHVFPEWHVWDEFGLGRSKAMSIDGLNTTRPIHFKVSDPAEANEMFDTITYNKGASVLRMLEKYVSEWVFQSGVDRYLSAHAFGNATTHEFWLAIQQASAFPIVAMMKNWIGEPGFPLIGVALSRDGKRVTLTQSRFLFDADGKAFRQSASSPSAVLWDVPVRIKTWAADERPAVRAKFLSKAKQLFSISTPCDLLIANEDASGFYAVYLQPQALKALEPQIQLRLSPSERLALVRDQWNECLAGQVSPSQYLDLTGYFKNESDPEPMIQMLESFKHLSYMIDDQSRPAFQTFVRDRLGPLKEKLGWKEKAGETDLTKQLRAQVLMALGTYGQDSATVAESRDFFNKYKTDRAAVDPNLLDAIVEIIAFNGDAEDYAALLKLHQEAKTPEEEQRDLMALCYFQVPELFQKTLAMSLTSDVRKQDVHNILDKALKNRTCHKIAASFVMDNWQKLCDQLSPHQLPKIIEAFAFTASGQEEDDLQAFFASHPVPVGKITLAQTLEKVHVNVNFVARSGHDLDQWLAGLSGK